MPTCQDRKRGRRGAPGLAAALFALAAGAAHPAPAQEPPDALLRRVGESFLNAIRNDEPSDRTKRLDAIDAGILPYVDVQHLTMVATGRAWRDATPDQQSQLTRQLRTALVRSIATALSRDRYERIDVAPTPVRPEDEFAEVRAQATRAGGAPIPLTFRMEAIGGSWKVYDVEAAGVWLDAPYQALFRSDINREGIDGLIRDLTERNRRGV